MAGLDQLTAEGAQQGAGDSRDAQRTTSANLPDRLAEQRIVREAAAPLGNIDNLTVIDPAGASKLTDTVVRTAAEGTAIAKSLLGVDLAELMGRLATRRNGGEKG